MSGNIQDTNVMKIRSDVYLLLDDLKDKNVEYIKDNEYLFEKKYKYLISTSNGLYKFIINQHKSSKFNRNLFENNLEMMLTKISKIQNKEESQYDASASVGTSLATQFFPKTLYKK